MIGGMRRAAVVLALGTVLVAAGCGGSHLAATSQTNLAVTSASCAQSGGAGQPTTQSCMFVLSDGERYECARPLSNPTAAQLKRAGCRKRAPLALSGPVRALIARIDRARSCLMSKRMRAAGGATLPLRPPGTNEPDGELVITSTSPSFIAFYTDAARASRTLPALERLDAGKHVGLERRGAVTIAWSAAPAASVRDTVWTCVSG
jgi:hypothetical protein